MLLLEESLEQEFRSKQPIKEWLEDDDTLFSNLSKQIMLQMKAFSNNELPISVPTPSETPEPERQ